jgi:hypothetical protein
MNTGSNTLMNTNFRNNILIKGSVNGTDGTDEELLIKNNILQDTNFKFSLMAKTWGDVTARQEFEVSWYVNKVPEFAEKPELITIDVDYDKVLNGTDKKLFTYYSPDATDLENNKIIMSFKGLEFIPCECVKVVQVGNGYKVSVYKDRVTEKDANTWKIMIDIVDDET